MLKIEASISSKNQVTIPKFIRETLNLKDGKIVFVQFEDGKIGLEAPQKNESKFVSDELFNTLFDDVTNEFDDVFKKLVNM
jgi:AbrB family looped-hinge helix DNA binding protein